MTELEKRQILHPFVCKQFGFKNLREILEFFEASQVHAYEFRGGATNYASALLFRMHNSPCAVSEQDLTRYNANIVRHSQNLSMNRADRNWKPFQYIALLFTEHYLNRYFNNRESLLEDLQSEQANHSIMKKESLYSPSDLHSLAFQSATGSGKTLIMQANIRQYIHYFEKANKRNTLNKVILITPNASMSEQHLRELEESGFYARLFSNTTQELWVSDGIVIDIIDIHKLDEKDGVKRVAVDKFEENNLVIIDEGHLGTQGKKWRKHRATLSRNGFTMEYSATFNQAVAKNELKSLRTSYAKSIVFDYPYKEFYKDGYGKDYDIKNLPQDDNTNTVRTYLLACLLEFYQQCRVFAENPEFSRTYNIATPLLVFIGRQVTGSKTQANLDSQSEVMIVFHFLNWFISEKHNVIGRIQAILEGESSIVDVHGNNVFADSFPVIKKEDTLRSKQGARNINKKNSTNINNATMQYTELYQDICKKICNGEGILHVEYGQTSKEIVLRVGNALPFAVINVGEGAGLFKTISDQNNGSYSALKNAFLPPYFQSIDSRDSPIRMVIGARKFVMGWSSWRVSTMGLLNVGVGEGSQIIQMFGRGVRLKGKGISLKRHTSELESENGTKNNALSLLETLNIFGVRSNYMAKFKEYLEAEGLVSEWVRIPLHVTYNFGRVQDLELPVIPEDLPLYAYSTERVRLSEMDTSLQVSLNLLKTVQVLKNE